MSKTEHPSIPDQGPARDSGVLLAVNGTLMRGLKLNPNMHAAGAFIRERLWNPCMAAGRSTTTTPQ